MLLQLNYSVSLSSGAHLLSALFVVSMMTRAEQRSVNLTLQIIASSHPDTAETARRLSALGTITTVIGINKYAYSGDGDLATKAAVQDVETIIFDAAGNTFFSDYTLHVVRKVSKRTGVITTVAGTGTPGYSGNGGLATLATLNRPTGLAFDTAGNLYIACASSNVVQMVSKSTGIISTVAGTGVAGYSGDNIQATSSELNVPFGIAIDKVGNMYISDTAGLRVRQVVLSTGIITTIAGTGHSGDYGDGGQATAALLGGPIFLALNPSNGNLYFPDAVTNRVRMIDMKTGIISTAAGTGHEGYNGDGILATQASLYYPGAVVFDAAGQNMYISDAFNCRVRKVAMSTGIITTVAGNGKNGYSGDNGPATSAQLGYPWGLGMDKSGNIYVADLIAAVVRSFSTVHHSVDFLGCTDLVLQAQAAITFGGAHNAITGDIGISPGTSITGDYAISNNGITHINEGPSLDCAIDMATIAAQAAALPCMNIPAELGE